METMNDNLILKCPNCQNNIKINRVKFSMENDFGGIIVECEKCKENSFFKIYNPMESHIVSGGIKIDYWDNEIQSDSDVLNKYNNIKKLEKGILVKENINQRELFFDVNKENIHYCKNCDNSIEQLVYSELDKNQSSIISEYSSIISVYYKGYCNPKYIVVKLPIQCTCGFKDESILYTNFSDTTTFRKNGVDELLLIGTENHIESTKIDRIGTKTECIEILEKFILRWNFLFPKILIATPFVGHQWMKDNEILELWEWITNYLDPNKSIFITRKATFNKYKKAFEKNNGVSLEFLEDYDLDNKVISNFTSKQDFHAKVFIGFSNENSEFLCGSFNLVKGNSFENLAYTRYSANIFKKNFIDKLKIPINLEKPEDVNCALIYVENNEFKSTEVKKTEIDKILLFA